MKVLIATLIMMLIGVSSAQAQEHQLGITGSIITIGSSSSTLGFIDAIEELKPWSVGLVRGHQEDATRMKFVIERFSVREEAVATQDRMARIATMRSSLLALRAEETWNISILNKWKVRPSAGVFAGAVLRTGQAIANDHASQGFCGEDYCSEYDLPLSAVQHMKLEPTKGVGGPYLGVVVDASREIGQNAEVEAAYDAYSTYGPRFRANVNLRLW